MSTALFLALALAGAPRLLEVRHSGDYGPMGTGPSFGLRYVQPGNFSFYCQNWRLPDGEYLIEPGPSEEALFMSLIEDIEANSPSQPEYWICPHSPDFGITHITTKGDFVSNVCISKVETSRFRLLYALVQRLATTYCTLLRFAPPVEYPLIDIRTGKPPVP